MVDLKAVNTELGGAGIHSFGEPLDEFTNGIFKGLDEGKKEIGDGSSVNALRTSRDEIDEWIKKGYQLSKNIIE